MIKHTANIITISRIIAALSMLITVPLSVAFLVLYVFCGITDMADGFIARKMHLESQLGEKLDSIADLIFVAVCLYRILPTIVLSLWTWMWLVLIVLIRVINIISGHIYQHQTVFLHTFANKLIGLLLFLAPLVFSLIKIDDIAFVLCSIATFAAIQEGHFIRTRKN